MDEPGEFTIPLPPPLVPPPGLPHGDVVFFRREVEEDGPQRDSEDIMLRKVPTAVAMRFRASAGGRGMTHAQYLAALVALHEAMRAAAEGGNEAVAAELERLGLSTVSV
jgi:hypothetical protein